MSASLGTNVVKLVSGKIATQIIAIATVPILSRIFLPEHFGILQLFISISSVVVVIACMRYELSIPLGKDNKEAVSSLILSFFFSFLISFLALILVIVLRGNISIWFKSPELKSFLLWLPLVVLLGGQGNAIWYFASRLDKFGSMAIVGFFSSLGNILVALFLGLAFEASAKYLLVSYIVGLCLNVLLYFAFIGRNFFPKSDLHFQNIILAAKVYKKFPIFDIWSGLLSVVSIQFPAVILGIYFTTEIVGFYSLGDRIVNIPMSLLGVSISQVFLPYMAKQYNEVGSIYDTTKNMFVRLIQTGVFPMVFIGVCGTQLFGIIFGANWIEAGDYARVSSILVLSRFIISSLSIVFYVYQSQNIELRFHIGFLISRIIAIILGAQTGNPILTLAIFVLVSVIGYIFMAYWIFAKTQISMIWGIKIFIKYMILSLILILPTECLILFGLSVYIILFAILATTLVYIFFLCKIDPTINNAFIGLSIRVFHL